MFVEYFLYYNGVYVIQLIRVCRIFQLVIVCDFDVNCIVFIIIINNVI